MEPQNYPPPQSLPPTQQPQNLYGQGQQESLEDRLLKRLDRYMQDIKDALHTQDIKIDRQGVKIDQLVKELVTREEFDVLRQRVETQGTEIAVHRERLRVLDSDSSAEDTSRRQRPMMTWQLVLATLGVLTALFFDFIMTIISIVNLVILLKH